jgi:hypothetical protein
VADLAGDDEVALLYAVEVEALHALTQPLTVSGELGGDSLGFQL